MLHFAPGFAGLPLYAHLFLLQDGRIFFSGGRMNDALQTEPCVFDLKQNPVPVQPVPDLLDPVLRNQSASVLLPPAQDQRVMIMGGGPVGKEDKTDATDKVSIVDLKAANPEVCCRCPNAATALASQLGATAGSHRFCRRWCPQAGGYTPLPVAGRDLRSSNRHLAPYGTRDRAPACITPLLYYYPMEGWLRQAAIPKGDSL